MPPHHANWLLIDSTQHAIRLLAQVRCWPFQIIMGTGTYVKETSLHMIVRAVVILIGGVCEGRYLLCFIVIVGGGWGQKQLVFHYLLMSLKHFD